MGVCCGSGQKTPEEGQFTIKTAEQQYDQQTVTHSETPHKQQDFYVEPIEIIEEKENKVHQSTE